MAKKSLISEVKETQLAIELIQVGARLQVLESETSLSRERLLKLYKEVKGVSPPKGMLPFSSDWFLTWMPNVHASLFINTYRTITKHTECAGIEAVLKTYRLYQEFLVANEVEEVLSFTRAWTLIRFFDSRMLKTTQCCKCEGHFVVHPNDLHDHYECGLCNMPSRAGKTKKAKLEETRLQAEQAQSSGKQKQARAA